jgi:hypothetical protein
MLLEMAGELILRIVYPSDTLFKIPPKCEASKARFLQLLVNNSLRHLTFLDGYGPAMFQDSIKIFNLDILASTLNNSKTPTGAERP